MTRIILLPTLGAFAYSSMTLIATEKVILFLINDYYHCSCVYQIVRFRNRLHHFEFIIIRCNTSWCYHIHRSKAIDVFGKINISIFKSNHKR